MTTAVLTKTQLELLKRKDKRNFENLKERLIVFLKKELEAVENSSNMEQLEFHAYFIKKEMETY
jgi:hypothetical protein